MYLCIALSFLFEPLAEKSCSSSTSTSLTYCSPGLFFLINTEISKNLRLEMTPFKFRDSKSLKSKN